MLKKNKAQSTLEYITVFSAIVAAIVVLAYTKLNPAVGDILQASADKMKAAAQSFTGTTANTQVTPVDPETPTEQVTPVLEDND